MPLPPGYNPPPTDQNQNIFGNLGNAFKNLFGGSTSPNAGRANTPSPTGAQFYQVKPTDNSMADVATNLGHPLPDLISANQGIKTLPTPGSYIQLPPLQQYQSPTTVPTTYPHQSGYYGPAPTPITPFAGQIFPNRDALEAERSRINTLVANGQMPPAVAFQTPILDPVTGQPVSDQQMLINGYTKNFKTGRWELKGANGTQTSVGNGTFANTQAAQWNAEHNVDFVNQLRWDPSRHKYVKIGQLIKEGKINIHSQNGKWYGRHGGGGGGQVIQPATPQTIGTANTVLSLHLGGE